MFLIRRLLSKPMVIKPELTSVWNACPKNEKKKVKKANKKIEQWSLCNHTDIVTS